MTTTKVSLNEKGEVTLTCPQCGTTQLRHLAQYQNLHRPLKVKCKCGCLFTIVLEGTQHAGERDEEAAATQCPKCRVSLQSGSTCASCSAAQGEPAPSSAPSMLHMLQQAEQDNPHLKQALVRRMLPVLRHTDVYHPPSLTRKQFCKRVLIAVAIGYLCLPYIGILAPPTVQVRPLPQEVPFNEDVEIQVIISGWHFNFQMLQTYFILEGATGLSTADALSSHPPRHAAWVWLTGRFAWPRSRVYTFLLPLHNLAQKGVVQPGMLKGRFAITLRWSGVRKHAPVENYRSAFALRLTRGA